MVTILPKYKHSNHTTGHSISSMSIARLEFLCFSTNRVVHIYIINVSYLIVACSKLSYLYNVNRALFILKISLWRESEDRAYVISQEGLFSKDKSVLLNRSTILGFIVYKWYDKHTPDKIDIIHFPKNFNLLKVCIIRRVCCYLCMF